MTIGAKLFLTSAKFGMGINDVFLDIAARELTIRTRETNCIIFFGFLNSAFSLYLMLLFNNTSITSHILYDSLALISSKILIRHAIKVKITLPNLQG